jgi:hypothetical protein
MDRYLALSEVTVHNHQNSPGGRISTHLSLSR